MTIQVSEILNFNGLSSPSVSASGQGRIYFDSGTNKFRFSESGAAYSDFGTGTGSGSGANTALSNLSSVAVNTALIPAANDGYNIGSPSRIWHDGYISHLYVGDGYFTNPTVSFTNEQTTGLYRLSLNRMGFAVGGVASGFIDIAPSVSQNSRGNTSIGYTAFQSLDLSGSGAGSGAFNNTAFGGESGVKLTTGAQNTYFGSRSGHENSTGSENTYLGQGAGYSITSSFNTAVGFHAGLNVTTGAQSVIIGWKAGEGVVAATGNNNVLIGYAAGQLQTSLSNTVAIGFSAGAALGTATDDVIIGYLAGTALTSGSESVIIGREAGKALTNEANNVIIGSNSGVAATSANNVFVGRASGISIVGGGNNTLIGQSAGFSGTPLVSGSNNTLIGDSAQVSSASASNRTAIGQGAASTADNNVQLGSTSVTTVTTSGVTSITPASVNAPITALNLSNLSTVASNQSAVQSDYRLAASWGDGYVAARIAAGKEAAWTGNAAAVDGYLSFSTVQDGSLNEWGRFTSAGTLQLNKTSGNVLSIPSGTSMSFTGPGGSLTLTGESGTRITSSAIIRSDNGYWIGGIVAQWTTGGISYAAGSALAWLRQTQTTPSDARLIGNSATVGSVATRVGTSATDGQGAKNSILFQACVDSAATFPISRFTVDGYGNSIQDGYVDFKVLTSPNLLPPVGLYSPAVNALSFTTGALDKMRLTSDGYLGINTTSPVSFLDGYGSFGLAVTVVATATTLTYNHHTVLADGYTAGFTVTLPAVSTVPRRRYEVKKIDSSSNTITVDGNASETIDGALTYPLTVQYQSVTLVSSGSAWYIV